MANKILHELKEHIPFTALATALATILVAIILILTNNDFISFSESLFEIFHPLHVLFSAFVTAAIFYKYKKRFIFAIIIGILGAIIIGSISDIILPYLEGNLLLLDTHFHLPIIEEPLIILLASLLGSLFGIILIKTKIPHFFHVFLSVFASLFYILAYSPAFSIFYLIVVFIIVFIAVLVPCCMSDIIFPLLFVKKK
jgi:hypothetical protein